MDEPSRIAQRVPDLGADGRPITVVGWLVEVGTSVDAGDRIVELLSEGIVTHYSATESGVLEKIEAHRGSLVKPGDLLGWIEPHTDP